jgi:hypothetical protein
MADRSKQTDRGAAGGPQREGYHVADLRPAELARLRELEEALSREHGEDVILIAYAPDTRG